MPVRTTTTRRSAATRLVWMLALWAAAAAFAPLRPVPAGAADTVQAAVARPAGLTPDAAVPAIRDLPPFRVELTKSAPMEGSLRVGGAASFAVRLRLGDKDVPGEGYECRWKSDGGAKFQEETGPCRTTAVFQRPGRHAIWVEAVPKSGPSEGRAGASEPLSVEVSQPAFAIVAQPASPLIGEDVTVSIRDFPMHEGVEFRWDPLPSQAHLVRVGERDLTFYATDAAPVPIRVTAAVPGSGPNAAAIGTAKTTVAAKPFAVTVDNRGLAEPPAVIWRDGQGPVPADGVAVGQNVRLRANVAPAPQHLPLAFAWGLCPGARSRGGGDTREIEASRRDAGPCAVTVEVRDSRGLLLGRGQGEFAVTVSQKELDAAVANAREVARLVRSAEEAWANGDSARALDDAGSAVRMSPADPQAVAALDRLAREAARLDGCLERARAALAADDFHETAAMLDSAAKINPKSTAAATLARDAKTRQETLGRVDGLMAQAREKWNAGTLDQALALAQQALVLDPVHAAARAERERMVAGRARLIAALKQATANLAAKRFDSAAKSLADAQAVSPRFPAVIELEKAIAARKDRAWRIDEQLARARDQWNAGNADAALATLTEACALDPEHQGAAAARKAMAQNRENLSRAEERAEAAIGRGRIDEAHAALAEAAKLNARHPRLVELRQQADAKADRDRQLAALRADAAKKQTAGDLDGAMASVNAMLALAPGNTALTAERDRLARTRDAAAEAFARARDALSGRRYDLALAALGEVEKLNARAPGLPQWRDKILAEKKRAETQAADRLAEAARLLDARDFAAAGKRLGEARDFGPLPPTLAGRANDLERRIEADKLRLEADRREDANRAAAGRQTAGDDPQRKGRCDALARQAAGKRSGGDHAGAIRDYQSLLTLCPDVCQAYNNVGASLFTLGYAAESLPWFDEAVKCAPGVPLFQQNAAMTRKKLTEPAKPVAEPAAGCDAAFAAAETRRGGGDLAGAIDGYRSVVNSCPNFCAAYNNMGLSLHKLGRTTESLKLFEQAKRCNPKDPLFKENYDLTVRNLRTAERQP